MLVLCRVLVILFLLFDQLALLLSQFFHFVSAITHDLLDSMLVLVPLEIVFDLLGLKRNLVDFHGCLYAGFVTIVLVFLSKLLKVNRDVLRLLFFPLQQEHAFVHHGWLVLERQHFVGQSLLLAA